MKKILLLLLFCSGCFTTQNHAVRLDADTFFGAVPGFGEIRGEGLRYIKIPLKGKTDENIYEIPETFWKEKAENDQ